MKVTGWSRAHLRLRRNGGSPYPSGEVFYSAQTEDARCELRALRIGRADRVLCVTGGARPLELALAGPREVVAVDANPAQNHLLELELAAIDALDYDDFLGFIGVTDDRARLETYAQLCGRLSRDARAFWDRRRRTVRAGIAYCGRWERALRAMSGIGLRLQRDLTDRLMSNADRTLQPALWQEFRRSLVWRGVRAAAEQRWIWRYIVRDAGVSNIAADSCLAELLDARFTRCALQGPLLRDNPYAWLIFHGRYSIDALPGYLQRANYDRLRSAVPVIRLANESLLSYLSTQPKQHFDAFSLSDFSAYTTGEVYAETWRAIGEAAKPGARFCERITYAHPPLHGVSSVRRDLSLEAELAGEDRSFIYEFYAGTVGVGN